MLQALCIYDFTAFSADADLLAIIEGFGFHPHGFNAFIAHQHDIRPVDGCFALDYPSLTVLGVGLRVPLHDIDILYEETFTLPVNLENLTDLAFIFAGDDLHLVIFFNMDSVSDHFISPQNGA